jgi:hypothetical protein
MLPNQTDSRWEALLTGKIQHQFKMTAAGLCVSRLQRDLAKDRSSAALGAAVGEVHAFFKKYETIMGEDISALFR